MREIIAGKLVVKCGPTTPERTHQSLTVRMSEMLRVWVGSRGEVQANWRFRMPSDEKRESYIPDVSLLFFQSAEGLSDEELEKPRLAPDIAVEVRSPDDKPARLAYKIATMLANRTRLVLEISPRERPVAKLRSIVASPLGDGLIFDDADVAIYVPGLLRDLFGGAFAGALGKRGGVARTAAKAAAARKNGLKGGRPRKPAA